MLGCSAVHHEMNDVISLRQSMLQGNSCEFSATITADYGDNIYNFVMKCTTDPDCNMRFEVVSPDTISGITGVITQSDGKLTFDEHELLFATVADGQLTPVTAPWVFMNALRSGYIRGCGKDGDGIHIQIDDSYADNAMQLEIWTDNACVPVRCEILWDGRRILSIDVADFKIL